MLRLHLLHFLHILRFGADLNLEYELGYIGSYPREVFLLSLIGRPQFIESYDKPDEAPEGGFLRGL